ncbi:anti-sigma factor family protein [Loktanella sp. DJP18]|uniref:anti-sigma factor family protein n=1 Tax=Loktanella sp. DJP18 TaxID=3409788 RepID=UPI003BB52F51
MTQHNLTNADLMAFADGEADGATAALIRTRLPDDLELAARLRAFTATRDAMAGLAAQDAAGSGLPPALAARLQATIGAKGAASPDPITAPLDRGATVVPLRRPTPRAVPVWLGALAASLALAVGLGTGLMLGGPSQQALDPVFSALDTVPSGDTVTLPDGRELRPVASFAASDGVFCREYEVSSPDGTGSVAIACADGTGWDTRLLIPTTTASGYAPAAAPDLLDTWYAGSDAGAPLIPEDEAAALAIRRDIVAD